MEDMVDMDVEAVTGVDIIRAAVATLAGINILLNINTK